MEPIFIFILFFLGLFSLPFLIPLVIFLAVLAIYIVILLGYLVLLILYLPIAILVAIIGALLKKNKKGDENENENRICQ